MATIKKYNERTKIVLGPNETAIIVDKDGVIHTLVSKDSADLLSMAADACLTEALNKSTEAAAKGAISVLGVQEAISDAYGGVTHIPYPKGPVN